MFSGCEEMFGVGSVSEEERENAVLSRPPSTAHLDVAVAEAARVEVGEGGEEWPHDGADRGGRRQGEVRGLVLATLEPPEKVPVGRVLHHQVDSPALLADDLC